MKYFLDTDQNSHWYIIPTQHRAEWNDWVDLDQDIPENWNVPEWARAIGGHPNQVEFENPTERD